MSCLWHLVLHEYISQLGGFPIFTAGSSSGMYSRVSGSPLARCSTRPTAEHGFYTMPDIISTPTTPAFWSPGALHLHPAAPSGSDAPVARGIRWIVVPAQVQATSHILAARPTPGPGRCMGAPIIWVPTHGPLVGLGEGACLGICCAV